MKSEAVIFTGKNQVVFDEVNVPDPGPNDIVIRTKYSWISNGTEGSFLRCERVDGVVPWLPGMPLPYPLVPGYQKVGVIEEVGANVTGFRSGQWVFATITKINGVHLGFGGHIAVGPSDAGEVIALPDGIDPIAFSGLVLTQVGYNTGMRGQAPDGACVVVVGDGMVGLWTAQTLQARGFRVALVGRHDARLAKFVRRDGDLVMNARKEPEWKKDLREWASDGLSIAADTVGNEVNSEVNRALLAMLARGGHFIAAGHHGSKANIDMRQLTLSELTLHCPAGWTRPRLISTMNWIQEGRLQTLPLVTHRMPASKAQEAWTNIVEQRDETLGVILEWQ